jgi:hypothetical protein
MQWLHFPANMRLLAIGGGAQRAVAGELRGAALLRGRSHHQCLQNDLTGTAAVFIRPSIYHRRLYSQKFDFRENPEVPFLERIGLRRRKYKENKQREAAAMSHNLYTDETPAEVKNAKGIHLLTMSTPNGQAVQIYLEELKDVYGIEWTTTLVDIMTNDQKKDWFLRLDPNGASEC